ncbi:23411_t:CDS:2, partial [Racocetra persica]
MVQNENRRLVLKTNQLRHRVRELEVQLEEQQEQIIESVQRNWIREEEHSRLV